MLWLFSGEREAGRKERRDGMIELIEFDSNELVEGEEGETMPSIVFSFDFDGYCNDVIRSHVFLCVCV